MRRLGSIAIVSFALLALPLGAHAQVICVSNNVPPPELPVYDQPPIPAPGYIWTPGYWAGSASGYFWVPGTWVQPPEVGLLWTPGYWGWRDGIYVWSAGYWGPHVGFYGGINYGFGYAGTGYEGGHWDHGVFAYNRTVNNFGGVHITNVYEKTVIVNQTNVRVSFNGGSGGITVRPTPEQEAAAHDKHIAADQVQLQHERTASVDKSLLASENHGHPAIAATAKPGEFSGPGVVAAREGKSETKPETPLATKPAGAEPGHPNPEMTKLPENKPVGNGLQQKEHELPRGEATINGATPPKVENHGEVKPVTPEAKPLSTETKPLTPENKSVEHEGKPPEGKPLEGKPLEAKPENHEAKLPPAEPKLPEPKPQLAPPPKPPAPPHAEAMPTQHPAPQAGHPPVEPQHGKPDPRDKKPPG